MQFSISINQKAFQEIAPECDLIDAAIFDFIRQFIASGRMKQKEEDGEVWYWFSHQKIINELPMIGIKSRVGIYNRLEKLIDCELLKRCPTNQKHSKSFFGRGEKFDAVIFHNEQPTVNENEQPLLTSVNGTVNENEQSTVNEREHNHNTNIDHNTNYQYWVDLWNRVNNAQCRITSKKRKQIRQRLNTYSKEELKKAIKNRSKDSWINGDGKKFKTDWQSFWRNDEKPERYLNVDSDSSNLFDQRAIMRKKRREHASRN